MAKIVELLASVARAHFDALLLLAGLLFILLGLVAGVSSADGQYGLLWSTPPRWGLVAVGSLLAAAAFAIHLIGKSHNRSDAGISADARARLEQWTPLASSPSSGSQVEAQQSLPAIGQAGLDAQRKRLESHRGIHPLVQIVSHGRLTPSEKDFASRAEEAYLSLSITNRAILKALYKHVRVSEIHVDELYPLVRTADDRAHLDSPADLVNRVLMLSMAGLLDLTVVGTRRSNARKIAAIGAVLERVMS